jgi:hypothetical protein
MGRHKTLSFLCWWPWPIVTAESKYCNLIRDPKTKGKAWTTDRDVPFNMALQALAHPDFSDDDVCLIWGTGNARVRTLREIKDLGYLCLREFGLENEETVRGEDPRSALGAFGGALGRVIS